MAVEEVQLMSIVDDAVVVYASYDTSDATEDEDIEAYRVVWDIPAGETWTVNIYRTVSGSVWRTTDLTGQGEYSDTKPFGPVKKMADLRFEVVG